MYLAIASLRLQLRSGQTLLKQEYFSILRRTITTTPVRHNIFNIGKRMRHENFYKNLDKVDPNCELIYRAPFEYLTALSKHVSTFSLVTVSAIILYKLAAGIDIINLATEFHVGPTMADGYELIGFSVAFFVFNFTMLYASAKYPLRIYRHKKGYIAMFEGYLPFKPRPLNFRRGDVLVTTKNILPCHESMYKIRNKSVLIFAHHFKKPSDFNNLLRKRLGKKWAKDESYAFKLAIDKIVSLAEFKCMEAISNWIFQNIESFLMATTEGKF